MVIVRNEKTFSYPETYVVLKEKDFAMFAGYRKKIAQRLINSAHNEILPSLIEASKRNGELQAQRLRISSKNRNKLYESAKKNKVLVSPLKHGLSASSARSNIVKKTITNEDINSLSGPNNSKRQFDKFKTKILESDKPRSRFVIFRSDLGDDVLSHELGHVENATSINPFKRFRSRLNQTTNIRPRFDNEVSSAINVIGFKERGIKSLLSRAIEDGLILGEERSANRNALKLLKKSGATKQELEKAKQTLDAGYETYNQASKLRRKSILANTIFPRERRPK